MVSFFQNGQSLFYDTENNCARVQNRENNWSQSPGRSLEAFYIYLYWENRFSLLAAKENCFHLLAAMFLLVIGCNYLCRKLRDGLWKYFEVWQDYKRFYFGFERIYFRYFGNRSYVIRIISVKFRQNSPNSFMRDVVWQKFVSKDRIDAKGNSAILI